MTASAAFASERSICAGVEGDEDDFPDFILEVWDAVLPNGIINEDQAVSPAPRMTCARTFRVLTKCVFGAAHLQGLCRANIFNPAVQYWSPQDEPAILGWNTRLHGHDRTRCYPMACNSGENGVPDDFCRVADSEIFGPGPPLVPTCVGDLNLDDGLRHGPEDDSPLEAHMCVMVECRPTENDRDGFNAQCTRLYRLEDAQCGDAGFCEYDGRLLLFEQPEGARENNFGFAEHCAQVCNDDGAGAIVLLCASMVGKTTGFS